MEHKKAQLKGWAFLLGPYCGVAAARSQIEFIFSQHTAAGRALVSRPLYFLAS